MSQLTTLSRADTSSSKKHLLPVYDGHQGKLQISTDSILTVSITLKITTPTCEEAGNQNATTGL